jgi:hypothetical protein
MRKQARRGEQTQRLWLGDWQRDEDTVTILPADEDDPSSAAATERSPRRAVALGAAIAVLSAAGFALISGGSNNSPTQMPQGQPQLPQIPVPQTRQGPPTRGYGGPDLTGRDAANAAEAAVAIYPGDVERVTRDPAGAAGYLVHVLQADGSEVHVLVSPRLQVEGSDASGGPSSFGRGSTQ